MQAVIFDMDGTLVDTERVSQAAWRAAARDFGIVIPESILHAFVGCSIPNAMKMIDEEFGDPDFTVRLFDRRHAIFDATWEDELELKPGAAEAVRAARQTGAACALATSSVRERAVASMERFDLMGSSTRRSSTRTSSTTSRRPTSTWSPPSAWAPTPRAASPWRTPSTASGPAPPRACGC